MKRITKVALYSLLAVLLLFAGSISFVFFFKDRIIQEFISEANKSLNTPVKIGKIEISTSQDFPNLSIVFSNVYVEDSHVEEFPLLTAKRISFSMNALEAWRGNYAVHGLEIKESETSLKINKKNEPNFTIVKSTNGKASSISFDLKDVRLIDTRINYVDQFTSQEHFFLSERLTASISVRGDRYRITADGDVLSKKIQLKDRLFLKNKRFLIAAEIEYDDAEKNVAVVSANLSINQSAFTVKGSYAFREKSLIDLKLIGKETSVQTILALLPDEATQKLVTYKSEGTVFFDLSLSGEISHAKDPLLSIRFGFTNATFTHPQYKSKITKANLEGSFATPSLTDFTQAVLHLQNVEAELNDKPLSCNLSVKNFEHPIVQFDFRGEVNGTSIQNFYPLEAVKSIEGILLADFSISGPIELLKNKSTAQQVKTSGTIDLTNVNIHLADKNVKFKNLNGSLQFNNNDLAMSNFKGEFENSDFILNGYFKNIVTFLLFDNQPVGIEADLKSDFLDVDQLFKIGFGEELSTKLNFHISPNLYLNFNCDIKNLAYKRFHPKQLKGNLLVKNQVAISRNIEMKTMGGNLQFNGIVDAKRATAIEVSNSFKLDGIYLDSVFYVFENFRQTFIEDTHLKGQAFADVSMEMTLTENLKLINKSLVADISATVKKGELNNFEPLQGLTKYLDDEGLSQLRFADLKNEIHIENETIYIPQMEIKSNVTTLQLSGTHTFDQKIAYRIIAPLRNKKKIDPDEAFGAIEETSKGKTQVFLKIIGTTDQYKISYDKEAVKQKIVSDLKKEVKELKEAFQLKGKKKKKELELEKDEYFDWDN